MENKGYQSPYGSTVIPPLGGSNGGIPASEHGPAGSPSIIPGAIGVAGPRVRNPDGVHVARAADDDSELSELAGLVEYLVDRISERVAKRVLERLDGPDQPLPSIRLTTNPPKAFSEAALQPETPFVGKLGNATIPTVVEPLPQDQIEAYSKAHAELEARLVKRSGVTLQRRAPEPPCWTTTNQNDVVSEWVAYSAAYDNPRFPVHADQGLYMVQADGRHCRLPHGSLLADGSPNGQTHWQIGLTLEQVLSLVDAAIAS